jgi:hypothetical protein
MAQPLMHILVPVDLNDEAPAGPRLAVQLAAGSDALVTLLYVDPRPISLERSDQLDALTHLHAVTTLAPRASTYAPAYPEPPRAAMVKRLRAFRDQLADVAEGADVRLVWRRGDLLDETLAFIAEAGVDVVVADAPGRRASAEIRRLQTALLSRRPCHVLTAHSPRAAAAARTNFWSAHRWRRLVDRWRSVLLGPRQTPTTPAASPLES